MPSRCCTGALATDAGDDSAIERARGAGRSVLVVAPSATSAADKVREEVERLLSSGLSPGENGLVSLRGRTGGADAILSRERIGRHAPVGAEHPEMEERLVV